MKRITSGMSSAPIGRRRTVPAKPDVCTMCLLWHVARSHIPRRVLPQHATTRALRHRSSKAVAVVTGTATPPRTGIPGCGRLLHPGTRDPCVVWRRAVSPACVAGPRICVTVTTARSGLTHQETGYPRARRAVPSCSRGRSAPWRPHAEVTAPRRSHGPRAMPAVRDGARGGSRPKPHAREPVGKRCASPNAPRVRSGTDGHPWHCAARVTSPHPARVGASSGAWTTNGTSSAPGTRGRRGHCKTPCPARTPLEPMPPESQKSLWAL